MSQSRTLYFQDGNIYHGPVAYSAPASSYLPHGYGTMTRTTGDTYTGYFSQGYKHGQGTSYSHTQQRWYEGGFVADREEGYATVICPNDLGGQRTYRGAMENNMRHGRGQQMETTTAGRTILFEGTWNSDVLTGPGRFTLTEAGITHTYQGTFLNGRLEGWGTYNTSQSAVSYNVYFQGGNMTWRTY
jgi:hypothetical protein